MTDRFFYDEEKLKELYSTAKESGAEDQARKTIELSMDLTKDMIESLERSINKMNLTFESARIKQEDSELPASVKEWRDVIIRNSLASVLCTIATKDFSREDIFKILNQQYDSLEKKGLIDPETGKLTKDKQKLDETRKNG